MTALPASGILPPPPWRLRDEFVREQRRRAAVWFVGALAAGAYLVGYGVLAAIAIVRDMSLHAGETVAVPASWDGTQGHSFGSARFLFGTTTVGRVTYWTENGRPWSRPLELWTMSEFDTSEPIVVLHDPQDRSRWTTNWSIEQLGNRAAQCGLALVVIGGATLGCLWRAVCAVRLLRTAQRVAPDGTAAIGTIEGTKQHEGRYESSTSYRVRVELADGRSINVRASYLKRAGRPLTLPGRRVLLLVGTGGREGLVLRQDLWPLRLSDDAVAHACEVLQRVDPDAGWRTTTTLKGLRLSCSTTNRRSGARDRS